MLATLQECMLFQLFGETVLILFKMEIRQKVKSRKRTIKNLTYSLISLYLEGLEVLEADFLHSDNSFSYNGMPDFLIFQMCAEQKSVSMSVCNVNRIPPKRLKEELLS